MDTYLDGVHAGLNSNLSYTCCITIFYRCMSTQTPVFLFEVWYYYCCCNRSFDKVGTEDV